MQMTQTQNKQAWNAICEVFSHQNAGVMFDLVADLVAAPPTFCCGARGLVRRWNGPLKKHCTNVVSGEINGK